jgi:hypothetical protein
MLHCRHQSCAIRQQIALLDTKIALLLTKVAPSGNTEKTSNHYYYTPKKVLSYTVKIV